MEKIIITGASWQSTIGAILEAAGELDRLSLLEPLKAETMIITNRARLEDLLVIKEDTPKEVHNWKKHNSTCIKNRAKRKRRNRQK